MHERGLFNEQRDACESSTTTTPPPLRDLVPLLHLAPGNVLVRVHATLVVYVLRCYSVVHRSVHTVSVWVQPDTCTGALDV